MKYIVRLSIINIFLFCSIQLSAQTFALKFEEITKNGTDYEVDIFIAFSNSGELGTSNLQFTYTNATINNPTLTSHNLTDSSYSVSVTELTVNKASLNIVTVTDDFGDAITVSPAWTNIGRIHFDVIDAAGTANLTWSYKGGSTETIVFLENNTTQIYTSNVGDLQHVNNSSLPVELCCFQAKVQNNQTFLTWKTLSETNNSHFNIQRSNNGIEFKDIGRVEGNGTTQIKQNYQFLDEHPLESTNYYRLQQVDFNETIEYSNTISVDFQSEEKKITLLPNPNQGIFELSLQGFSIGNGSIEILTNIGQRYYFENYELTDFNTQIPINLKNTPSGIYILKLTHSNETVITKKLIVK